MKVRLTKDRKSGSRTLVVRPVKHEQLEYDEAEWLRTYDGEGLVAFRYVREGEVTLYYDVTGLVDLKSYLRAEISLDQFRRILGALAELLRGCTRQQLPTSYIQFDPEHIYLDAQGAPRFVLVPLSGVAERRESLPVALLHYLGAAHVHFVVPEDERHARALEDFASRNQVLSLSALREFIQSDLGVVIGTDSGSLDAAPEAGPSSRPASGSLAVGQGARATSVSRAGQVSAVPSSVVAAFDPVAMLSGAPSASQVVQGQSMGARVRDAVSGVSPTAAGHALGAMPPTPSPAPKPTAAIPSPTDFAPRPAAVPTPAAALRPATAPAPAAPAPAAPTPAAAPRPAAPTPAVSTPAVSTTPPAAPMPVPVVRQSAPRSHSAFLERVSDGARFRLPDAGFPMVVGRSASSDVQVSGNTNISRAHVEVARSNDGFVVRDLGSANGTFIAGHRLEYGEAAQVRPGDSFYLADEELRVVQG